MLKLKVQNSLKKLNEPISFRGLLPGEKESQIEAARQEKLQLLFQHYDLSPEHPDSWRALCLQLANDTLIGFQVSKVGATRIWNILEKIRLVGAMHEVRPVNQQKSTKITIKEAAFLLIDRFRAVSARRQKAPTAGSLATRYYEAKRQVDLAPRLSKFMEKGARFINEEMPVGPPATEVHPPTD